MLGLLLTLISIAGQVSFEFFEARTMGDDVKIEWKLEDESEVKEYIIERYYAGSNSYKKVERVSSLKKNEPYSYLDENNFSKPTTKLNAENFRRYRIQVNFEDGNFIYSNEVYVTHNVSSVRKTWGMLKEMFR